MNIIFDDDASIDLAGDRGITGADIIRQAQTFPGVIINGIRVCVEDDVAHVTAPTTTPKRRFTHTDEKED